MANTTLTQTGAQVQADLDKVEGLANIKTIGSGLSLSSAGELAASGGSGTAISGGYKFSAVYDGMWSLISYTYLGVSKTKTIDYDTENPDYNKYGWHFVGNSGGFDESGNLAVQENVSFIVINIDSPSSSDFVSITQNALYLYDGTAINDYNALVSAEGKLCFLLKDCAIKFED